MIRRLKFARRLFILTDVTPNENSLKFKPGRQVMKEGVFECTNWRDASKSPLAQKLFDIEGTESVFFGPDFITVTKSSEADWPHMKPSIYEAIMDFYLTQQELITEKVESGNENDSEVVVMIKELLDTRIRPSVQQDGGDIEFRSYDNGIVRLKLQGACRTCSSSVITLKSGIENMMKHYIPEIKSVEQVVDAEEEIGQRAFEELEEKIEAGEKDDHLRNK